MARVNEKLCAPNLIVVGVDKIHNRDYEGRIWTQYDAAPAVFSNTMDLLRKADRFFDRIQFPQRATQPRSFGNEMEVGEHKSPPENRKERKITMKEIDHNRGEKGTFIVQVKYRQNSTWQGQVIWAEENKKVYFRSALELMRLIDNALGTGEADGSEPMEDTSSKAEG
jgi:hypothetical protein